MRGLKAILTASGLLKRQMQDQKEDIVVFQAMMNVNLPKFTSNDVPLFNGIVSDLFPGVVLPDQDRTLLMQALVNACQE
jgi:dynein heavy chain